MSELIGTVIGVVVVLGLIIGVYSVIKHDDVLQSFRTIWAKIKGD